MPRLPALRAKGKRTMTNDRVDLAITNAHLWREDAPRDLFVHDGRFVAAPSGGAAAAAHTIDAGRPPLRGGFPGAAHPPRQGADQRRRQAQPLRHPRRGHRNHLGDGSAPTPWRRSRCGRCAPSARPSPAESPASAAMSMWTASAASARWKACSKRASAPATSRTFRSWPFRRRASSRTRAPTI